MNEAQFNHITDDLKQQLPSIASQLIEKHADMTHPRNQSFAAYPNDPSEHAPAWHQYGIVEHSEKFHDSMKSSVLEYVEQWGLGEPVEAALSEAIDGVPKKDLLSVTALLHDIGKFTARTVGERSDGSPDVHFVDHEAESGRVIRENPVNEYLVSHGLTDAQIEYVARTAELHFELGKMRRVAKSTEVGYTMAFTETPEFEVAITDIINQYPDFAVEIGLQFIADALSKSEDFSMAMDDEGIEADRPKLQQRLVVKGLDKDLLSQVLQVPVNLRVAELYLKRWAER